ncbi:TetR/AcrR family transcriptional regulator [Polluticaenibacter yanchengensis]|uniref:TetR/AcrR family transcriptional regulator n=1 Tax=Polluticaenibacter yanchengensis TaxID=3014562 RepID=A0ABT4UII1_9BACT|nr:TetR/AcrR family transcriptional regulator [Chitinophagaceae bacterium LY-5]
MAKSDNTRLFIIETTAPLFNVYGYANTSLADITAATALSKGSIYGNFTNKDELAEAAFSYSAKQQNTALKEAIESVKTPLDKLNAIVTFFASNWAAIKKTGGCPLLNAAVEADDAAEYLKKTVKDSFTSWINTIASVLDAGVKAKTFSKDLDTKQTAALFVMIIEGGVLLAKTYNSNKHMQTAIDQLNHIIKSQILKK